MAMPPTRHVPPKFVVNFAICRFGHKPYGFQEATSTKGHIG
jgi:hypothetical protein